jgi:TnpA family transposase
VPGRFLSEAERGRLRRFPDSISSEDVVAFFTLSEADLAQVRKRSGDYNRLGFALQLCTLRYLGYSPHDLAAIPAQAVAYVARQLRVAPQMLISYGARDRTRHQQLRAAMQYLGLRRADLELQRGLADWLLERALEHDKPSVLLELLCEKLRASKILRPGITCLERMVAAAREGAWAETFRRMESVLGPERRDQLDVLLRHQEATGRIPLVWLRQGETSNSADAILNALARLEVLETFDTSGLAAAGVPPNRLKFLARIGRKATTQALLRMPEARRYQVLLAFVDQAKIDVRDEAIDLFDRCLAQAYANAGRELKELRQKVARATNEKVHLLRSLGAIVLDPTIDDEQVRARIYDVVDPERLHDAIEECVRIARPLDDSYFDLLADRYSHIRKFAPAWLAAFEFRAGPADAALLEAVTLLRRLNAERTRKIPADAPLVFIPARWWPYVVGEDRRPNRRYYELCVLWELRGALRAGNLWIEKSRRYGDPASLLVPPDAWEQVKGETCAMLGLPADATARLSERCEELGGHLRQLEDGLPANSGVRIEDGQLVVTPLSAEQVPESTSELERLVSERLPRVDLADLLIEVDGWTGFSRHLTHAAGGQPRTRDERTYLYAAILAEACNFGTSMMAEVAELDARRLAWYTTWYLREETLRAAMAAVVDYQHRLPLAARWGGGTLSSSDGQRCPAAVKTRGATALPRYFGYGRGLTFYTWTSDQYSQYGTKVIASTVRDATHVLDEILDNETELEIAEHTTDTAGYTDLVFALFDLLGLQFSPRIRDLGDQRLFRMDGTGSFGAVDVLLKGSINEYVIRTWWEEMLRVAGSLKLGWVTASLLIGKLQAFPRRNALTGALQEYGRLVKTIFVARYLQNEDYRRRIRAQLNKGEALHALRAFLFFANEAKLRKKQEEQHASQAGCLNLVTNAVVAWNTVYLDAVLNQLRREGATIDPAAVGHLSPARHRHINPYGRYRFELADVLTAGALRPLRAKESLLTEPVPADPDQRSENDVR